MLSRTPTVPKILPIPMAGPGFKNNVLIGGKKFFWLQPNGTRHTSEGLKRPTFLDTHSCPIKILDRIDHEVLPREFQPLCTIVEQTRDRFL